MKFFGQRRRKILKNIEYYVKRNILSIALDLAVENNFLDKEIEISEKYIDQYSSLPHVNFIDRMEKLGCFKFALKMSETEPLIMNLQNIKRIKKYLKCSDSDKITDDVFNGPEFKNDFFKELYYAKENGNFANLSFMIDDKNLIKVNPITYLYERIYRN
jgi:hypothetical protein